MTKALVQVYDVAADRETGEWLHDPVATGKSANLDAWNRKIDTSRTHYDTYEAPFYSDETGDRIGEETRAIRVRFVKGDK